MKIGNEIEDSLFSLHEDITFKYKNKYRSLLFNLKDVKNQVCTYVHVRTQNSYVHCIG